MGFVWETTLQCTTCNAVCKGRTVEYDELGYPICPACGKRQGPGVTSSAGAPRNVAE